MVTAQPNMVPIPGSGTWGLVDPFVLPYSWENDPEYGDIALVRVPAGYETDGASILWLLQILIASPFAPEVVAAALIHDYLYTMQGSLDRARADALLRDVAIANHLARWRAVIMWLGVRLFGWHYWRRHRGQR